MRTRRFCLFYERAAREADAFAPLVGDKVPFVIADSLVVTGANGRIGQSLLRGAAGPARALVRSQRAAAALAGTGADVRVIDLRDVDALARAAEGCTAWIHLVGILKETRAARYADAH
ncbi:MAG TPA: NAD(P)H-binding protein, partial [Myxococcota bacterium]|nr:NAD(P)H-binding protein [Myxococcota bacterium]